VAHRPAGAGSARSRSLNLSIALVGVLVLVAGAAIGLVLALQDDDSGGGNRSTTTAVLPNTPEGYADALYSAWKANDRTAAGRVASREAVDEIFAVAYQPIQTNSGPQDPYTKVQPCEGAAGSAICTWKAQDGATISMQVRNTTGGLPILVVGVQRTGG